MSIPNINLKDLVEAGVHFGHKSQRWNPKMSKYIHSTRENIHIINLNYTVHMLTEALNVINNVVSKGGKILFVATKKQASSKIANLATETNQYYVNHRWLGGMLTNWSTIAKSIKKMKELEILKSNPNNEFTKKEILKITNQHNKLVRSLSGISEMKKSPDLVFIIELKLDILFSKLTIILSFKITFSSKSLILSKVSANSSLAPSPVIRSLITSFAIGFCN